MAHPYHHALSSVKKWGGTVDDFIAVHAWFAHSTEVGHLFHGIVGSHSTRRWAADLTDGFMESGLC
jgi:hypothetical protein